MRSFMAALASLALSRVDERERLPLGERASARSFCRAAFGLEQ